MPFCNCLFRLNIGKDYPIYRYFLQRYFLQIFSPAFGSPAQVQLCLTWYKILGESHSVFPFLTIQYLNLKKVKVKECLEGDRSYTGTHAVLICKGSTLLSSLGGLKLYFNEPLFLLSSLTTTFFQFISLYLFLKPGGQTIILTL